MWTCFRPLMQVCSFNIYQRVVLKHTKRQSQNYCCFKYHKLAFCTFSWISESSCVILTLTGLPPCHRVTWLASLGWVEIGGITAVLIRPFTFTETEILILTALETFSLNWFTLSTSYLPFFPVSSNRRLLDDLFHCVLIGLLERPFTNQSELMRQCVN